MGGGLRLQQYKKEKKRPTLCEIGPRPPPPGGLDFVEIFGEVLKGGGGGGACFSLCEGFKKLIFLLDHWCVVGKKRRGSVGSSLLLVIPP